MANRTNTVSNHLITPITATESCIPTKDVIQREQLALLVERKIRTKQQLMMSEAKNTQGRAPSSDDTPLSDIHALTTTCSTVTTELQVLNFLTALTGHPQNEQGKNFYEIFDFLFRLRWSFLDLRLKLLLE